MKIYQVTTKEKRQTLPSKIKPNKIMTLTQINLIGRPLILLKITTKGREGQTIHSEANSKFVPLLMENIDDFTTCESRNVTSANSKKPCQNPLFSNNDKFWSVILKEKEDQMFVSLKII